MSFERVFVVKGGHNFNHSLRLSFSFKPTTSREHSKSTLRCNPYI